MHPPFIFTDHKVGPDTFRGRPKVRRSLPQRLILRPMTDGWPPLPVVFEPGPPEVSPSGQPVLTPVYLTIVPPPRSGIRDTVGRWLIRLGQRMILQNHPG